MPRRNHEERNENDISKGRQQIGVNARLPGGYRHVLILTEGRQARSLDRPWRVPDGPRTKSEGLGALAPTSACKRRTAAFLRHAFAPRGHLFAARKDDEDDDNE